MRQKTYRVIHQRRVVRSSKIPDPHRTVRRPPTRLRVRRHDYRWREWTSVVTPAIRGRILAQEYGHQGLMLLRGMH